MAEVDIIKVNIIKVVIIKEDIIKLDIIKEDMELEVVVGSTLGRLVHWLSEKPKMGMAAKFYKILIWLKLCKMS